MLCCVVFVWVQSASVDMLCFSLSAPLPQSLPPHPTPHTKPTHPPRCSGRVPYPPTPTPCLPPQPHTLPPNQGPPGWSMRTRRSPPAAPPRRARAACPPPLPPPRPGAPACSRSQSSSAACRQCARCSSGARRAGTPPVGAGAACVRALRTRTIQEPGGVCIGSGQARYARLHLVTWAHPCPCPRARPPPGPSPAAGPPGPTQRAQRAQRSAARLVYDDVGQEVGAGGGGEPHVGALHRRGAQRKDLVARPLGVAVEVDCREGGGARRVIGWVRPEGGWGLGGWVQGREAAGQREGGNGCQPPALPPARGAQHPPMPGAVPSHAPTSKAPHRSPPCRRGTPRSPRHPPATCMPSAEMRCAISATPQEETSKKCSTSDEMRARHSLPSLGLSA